MNDLRYLTRYNEMYAGMNVAASIPSTVVATSTNSFLFSPLTVLRWQPDGITPWLIECCGATCELYESINQQFSAFHVWLDSKEIVDHKYRLSCAYRPA